MFKRHGALAAFLAIVGLCWLSYRPAPVGRAKALLLCGDCGIAPTEIESLNDPATSRALWESTYTDAASLEAARKLCSPCVEAIIETETAQALE